MCMRARIPAHTFLYVCDMFILTFIYSLHMKNISIDKYRQNVERKGVDVTPHPPCPLHKKRKKKGGGGRKKKKKDAEDQTI